MQQSAAPDPPFYFFSLGTIVVLPLPDSASCFFEGHPALGLIISVFEDLPGEGAGFVGEFFMVLKFSPNLFSFKDSKNFHVTKFFFV